jgi:hypothetical protein
MNCSKNNKKTCYTSYMKKQLNLLLTLMTPLLLINCSSKSQQPHRTIQNTTPINSSRTIHPSNPNNNQEALGRPIKRDIAQASRPKQPIQEGKRPVLQHASSYGSSSLSQSFKLPRTINESSGLIKIDGRLWTINDSGGEAKLYQIDEKDGHIVKSLHIKNARNRDWESLAYDENYVYIGDTGNNRGDRRDLKIYKIPRGDLKNRNSTRAEVIQFSYSDQKDFKSKPQKSNFDCEAMVANNGKIYLFSKNWGDQQTRLYELSTRAGKQIAKYKSRFNIQSLVTGATLNKELDILLLSSYSTLLNVQIWVFTNYSNDNFFNGASKKLTLPARQAQIEGITFIDNYKAYLSSESFSKFIFSFDASIYSLDFSKEFN